MGIAAGLRAWRHGTDGRDARPRSIAWQRESHTDRYGLGKWYAAVLRLGVGLGVAGWALRGRRARCGSHTVYPGCRSCAFRSVASTCSRCGRRRPSRRRLPSIKALLHGRRNHHRRFGRSRQRSPTWAPTRNRRWSGNRVDDRAEPRGLIRYAAMVETPQTPAPCSPPSDPEAFLAWAAERQLMRRVGGGFQFRHLALRDLLADESTNPLAQFVAYER